MPAGSGDEEYRQVFSAKILPAIDAFAPEFVIVSAGFDAHVDDPLANICLSTGFFGWMTARLMNVWLERMADLGLERYEELEKRDRDYPGLAANLGELYLKRDRFDKAAAAYRRALKGDQLTPKLMIGAAKAFVLAASYAEALKWANRVLRDDAAVDEVGPQREVPDVGAEQRDPRACVGLPRRRLPVAHPRLHVWLGGRWHEWSEPRLKRVVPPRIALLKGAAHRPRPRARREAAK